MKKIYMRTGVSPFEKVTPVDVLNKNIIGGNSGNLMYQYSMVKTLSTNNVEIIPSRYKTNLSDVNWINRECNAFVIPLADAFRKDFVEELRNLTKMIKKLTIPCIVTGVGLRAPYEPDFSMSFSFDNDVKEFVKAVLEKSTMLGLRGEITARYLKKLGFKEERDFTVIGCPSLYMNGDGLKIKEKNINIDSIISYNSSPQLPKNIQRFIQQIEKDFERCYFIAQDRQELRLIYSGISVNADDKYPCKSVSDSNYINNKLRFFINVPSWIKFLEKMDLSIGTRFHGNVASVLAGTPSIFIPHDARTRELVNYHNLTSVSLNELDEKVRVLDLINKVDFHSVEKSMEKNFKHFIEFLNINNLEHIYENSLEVDKYIVDFEKKVRDSKIYPPIETLSVCNTSDILKRMEIEMLNLVNKCDIYKSYNNILNKWLFLKNHNISLEIYFEKFSLKNIAMYGVGSLGNNFYQEIKNSKIIHIKYAIDRISNRDFNDIKVVSLEESDFVGIDVIVVTAIFDYENIKNKIKNSTKNDKKIISLQTVIDYLYTSNKE